MSVFLFLIATALAAGLPYNPWVVPTPEEKVVVDAGWTDSQERLLIEIRDAAYPLLMEQMGWPINREQYTVVKADEHGCVPELGLCLEPMQWGATAPWQQVIILRDPTTIGENETIDYRRGYIHELCHTFRGWYVNNNLFVEEGLCEYVSDQVAAELGVPNIRPIVSWEQIKGQPIPWANFGRDDLDATFLSYRFAAAFWGEYLKDKPNFFRSFHDELLYSQGESMTDERLEFALMRTNVWFNWRPYFTPVEDQALIVTLGFDEDGNHDLWIELHEYKDGKLVREPIHGMVSHSTPEGSISFPTMIYSDVPLPYEVRYKGALAPGTVLKIHVFPPSGPPQIREIIVTDEENE